MKTIKSIILSIILIVITQSFNYTDNDFSNKNYSQHTVYTFVTQFPKGDYQAVVINLKTEKYIIVLFDEYDREAKRSSGTFYIGTENGGYDDRIHFQINGINDYDHKMEGTLQKGRNNIGYDYVSLKIKNPSKVIEKAYDENGFRNLRLNELTYQLMKTD